MRLRTQARFDRVQKVVPLGRSAAERMLRDVDPAASLSSLDVLAGGFSSTNYLVSAADGRRFVIRLAERPARRWHAELDVMGLAGDVVPVPRVLWRGEDASPGGVQAAVVEFVEGDLLDDLEFTSTEQARSVGRALGGCLAAIHSVTFPHAGFLGPGLAVEPLPGGGRGVIGLFETLLNDEVVRARLADLVPPLGRVIAEGTAALAGFDPPAVLVHSDFNAKNILVRTREPGVAAVLDWEFAFAGPALIDIGNFLRFDRDFPPGLKEGFLLGYAANGGALAPGFNRYAKLHDLTALLQFLSRPEAGPRTIATSLECIEDTILRWERL